MYLVEEFGDKLHLRLPVRSLEQAISNTQVYMRGSNSGLACHVVYCLLRSLVLLVCSIIGDRWIYGAQNH